MILLSQMLAILILSIISALIGFGFNKMQDDGMIFSWYHNWLQYLANNKFKSKELIWFNFKVWWNKYPPKWTHFNLRTDNWFKNSGKAPYKKSKLLYYLTKPLGLCIICNTTWIGIIITIILLPIPIPIRIFYAICVGISSASIVIFFENIFKLIQKHI